MFTKIKEWYNRQNDTVKAMVWIGIVCIIGIILRWNWIIERASAGFNYYSGE